ncbi:MAG: hypothetical protein GWP05_07240 [Anaerolineaceae bacterium]|nr:hypothetical protein [Anaerolineaceae bacterium]
MVLIIVGVIFVLGLAAITSAVRTTQMGENYVAAAVALQAAQNGIAVADRRLVHPWYVGYTIGEDWPGINTFDQMPDCSDGLGGKYDMYYNITVNSTADRHTVTAIGLAVVAGGQAGSLADVKAVRTVQAVFDKPKLQVPYAILSERNLRLRPGTTVEGDVFSNQDVIIAFGARVTGNVYAVGSITNFGTIQGQQFTGQAPVPLPPITYYGYRPSYDYNGLDNTAIELAGKSLDAEPPMGMPNNPNNLFYSNRDPDFKLKDGVTIDGGTMITMYSLKIKDEIDIEATSGFPAMIINRDLILKDYCDLTTEGLVQVGREVKAGDGLGINATWVHKGPLVLKGNNGFSATICSEITITYDVNRVDIQPVGRMVLPLVPRSYTETP